MDVQIIKNKELLETVEPFEVNHLLWGTKRIAKTYGYIGFVQEEGFYLKLVCLEKDPLRIYTKDQDPVYKDSAMEAFFQFKGADPAAGEIYLNFEMNANGALLACYGVNKTDRIPFPAETVWQMGCKAQLGEDRWSVNLFLPVVVLERIYGKMEFREGTMFTCNFYKICESKENEHYASYEYVESGQPNFHLPEYFAKARIVRG